MPLLNYTTTIQAMKTISEIQNILAKHGARSILTEYGPDGHVKALSFQVATPYGDLAIRLPVDPDAVLKILQRQGVPKSYQNRPQAIRIAWRIVKNWVDAQMAILETEMVKIEQVFLPYVIASNGKTVYELMMDNRFQLGEGKPE